MGAGWGSSLVLPGDREGAGLAPTLAPQPSHHVLPSAHGASRADLEDAPLQSSRLSVYLYGWFKAPFPWAVFPDTPLTPQTFIAGLGYLRQL